jgi:hypothetical protein
MKNKYAEQLESTKRIMARYGGGGEVDPYDVIYNLGYSTALDNERRNNHYKYPEQTWRHMVYGLLTVIAALVIFIAWRQHEPKATIMDLYRYDIDSKMEQATNTVQGIVVEPAE